MSAVMDSPLWRSSSPLNETDDPEELETIIKELSMDKTSDLNFSDNEMIEDESHYSEINDSESSETKSHSCTCNNNTNECEFVEKYMIDCDCLSENTKKSEKVLSEIGKELKKKLHVKKRKDSERRREKKAEEVDICQPLTRINGENKSCGISNEHNLATVGGDGKNRDQRSQCQQHELKSFSNEINRPDVITSCDLTSNFSKSEEKADQNRNKKDCPGGRLSSCSTSHSTCSEGSYSRRKHHKHHKHKQKNKSKSPVRTEDGSCISPKVNPIFLWVRQEDGTIMEVFCEDYDHRNRLRLTRTDQGWRAIPKTKRFSEAIIPRAKKEPKKKEKRRKKKNESQNKVPVKPKRTKSSKKQNKTNTKQKVQKNLPDNLIKECSVALYRDDLSKYEKKRKKRNLDEEESNKRDSDMESWSEPNLTQPSNSDCDPNLDQSRSPSQLSFSISDECLERSNKMIKSNSCDFRSLKKVLESLPRSISLDFNLKRNIDDFAVEKNVRDIDESENCNRSPRDKDFSFTSELEVEKEKDRTVIDIEEKVLSENELDELENQRNHSETIVDMTKHGSDFNDTDCDELGQLLKDIPDLEFVEEEELEEVDEEEDWLMPTDLTVPKSKVEGTRSKLPVNSLNISPAVTVTPSKKPADPLISPLPEVTITPIPNPKPAHQQKTKNNFLESLLSSTSTFKSETDRTTHKIERRSSELQCERKGSKHFLENDVDTENKNKKLKVEDITLKNLLSKHQNNKSIKSQDMEECSKSRLQELLTENICSDPISQLKEVLSNPHLAVPDPLLVPRARLPALVASPASEIPRLLTMHFEKAVEKTPCPPVMDSDVLEVSLSNLQSLLSCSPEKLKSTNTQDLANYQKTLETFLEWQRYQTELIEAQMKSSKSMSPGFTGDIADMAAATAFNQMFWLPYLNQLDLNCNSNRDFMSFVNTMMSNDYQANSNNLTAPPQININQVSQPSPFLTPTSPMDIESHLKTLAMWQEAVMMQQNSQSSRTCCKTSGVPERRSKVLNMPNVKNQRGSCVLPRGDPQQNTHFPFEIYQDMGQNEYQKKSRQNLYQQRLEEHQKQLEYQQKYKQEQQFRRMKKSYPNYQTEFMKQCKVSDRKKSGPMPGCISVKPLSNLLDQSSFSESKSSWEQFEDELKKYSEYPNQSMKHYQAQKNFFKERCFNNQPVSRHRNSSEKQTENLRRSSTDMPKLKVKNLVDPSKSPPKLLKQVDPEHLPLMMEGHVQDDSQANLWHPLFGSNQVKPHPYNSPWRWTTVTVNGE